MTPAAKEFTAARDFLIEHRDDYQAAYQGFRWPELEEFNYWLRYFTSGTTAQPKLVEHTHVSYPVGHLSTMYWIGLQPGDVHLNVSSPGWAKHAYSSVFGPWIGTGHGVRPQLRPRSATLPASRSNPVRWVAGRSLPNCGNGTVGGPG